MMIYAFISSRLDYCNSFSLFNQMVYIISRLSKMPLRDLKVNKMILLKKKKRKKDDTTNKKQN